MEISQEFSIPIYALKPKWFFSPDSKNTLVENMAKKNRSRFPIAVLLTTMLCNH